MRNAVGEKIFALVVIVFMSVTVFGGMHIFHYFNKPAEDAKQDDDFFVFTEDVSDYAKRHQVECEWVGEPINFVDEDPKFGFDKSGKSLPHRAYINYTCSDGKKFKAIF